MELLDVVTNYVSWLDDKKPGNYPENTLVLKSKRPVEGSVLSYRGRRMEEPGPEGNASIILPVFNPALHGGRACLLCNNKNRGLVNKPRSNTLN
jgi:hypothetical protein